jgi:hypothetical protein
MADPALTTAQLTRTQRDAIFEQIAVVFEFAGDLPWMLAHGSQNMCDRIYARDLIDQLVVAVRILDQLGWQPRGNRDGYVLEIDAGVDRFVAAIERDAVAALEDSRQGLLDGSDDIRASARQRIDRDLDALAAARLVRTVFRAATPPAAELPRDFPRAGSP